MEEQKNLTEGKQEETTSPALTDVSDEWDYVFLFAGVEEPRDKEGNVLDEAKKPKQKWNEIQKKRQEILERLKNAGLKYKVVRVQAKGNNDKDFVLITADDARLEREAERLGLSMKLKLEYGGGYSDFEIENRNRFRLNDPERGKLFRKGQKIQLLESIIEADDKEDTEDKGANTSFTKNIRDGTINKIYALHEPAKVKWLMQNWAHPRNMFKTQPIDEIREYFGEEVAIYFAWLGFYTSWLWLASIFGGIAFFFWIGGLASGTHLWDRLAVWSAAVYAVFLALWATLFLEFWKRYQNKLASDWGMMDFEEVERQRADYVGIRQEGLYYKGEWIVPWEKPEEKKEVFGKLGVVGKALDKELEKAENTFDLEGGRDDEEFARVDIPPVTNEYYPSPYRFGKIGAALPIIATMLIMVVISTFAVLSLRLFTQRAVASMFGSIVGGFVNALTIMFFNGIWRRVADIMTRWENHRTYTSYNDQLVFKIYMFQFVNNYTSLYYIAFFKNGNRFWLSNNPYLEDICKVGGVDNSIIGKGCVFELAVQLATMLITNITIGQTREVVLPYVISQIKLKLYKRSAEEIAAEGVTQYEKEANLVDFTGTFDEYNEMILQFGFVTLFATTFPISPFLAVINNMIEIRTDAIKLLTGNNRPHYRGAQDIGTWYFILEVTGFIAVVTNCLLIGFSYSTISELFADHDPFRTLVVIVILEHILILTKFSVSIMIPDMPGSVRKDMAKQEWIKNYTFKKAQERMMAKLKEKKN